MIFLGGLPEDVTIKAFNKYYQKSQWKVLKFTTIDCTNKEYEIYQNSILQSYKENY